MLYLVHVILFRPVRVMLPLNDFTDLTQWSPGTVFPFYHLSFLKIDFQYRSPYTILDNGEGIFDPRKLEWKDKYSRCKNTMCLDGVDCWYQCHKCGYEEPCDKRWLCPEQAE